MKGVEKKNLLLEPYKKTMSRRKQAKPRAFLKGKFVTDEWQNYGNGANHTYLIQFRIAPHPLRSVSISDPLPGGSNFVQYLSIYRESIHV